MHWYFYANKNILSVIVFKDLWNHPRYKNDHIYPIWWFLTTCEVLWFNSMSYGKSLRKNTLQCENMGFCWFCPYTVQTTNFRCNDRIVTPSFPNLCHQLLSFFGSIACLMENSCLKTHCNARIWVSADSVLIRYRPQHFGVMIGPLPHRFPTF